MVDILRNPRLFVLLISSKEVRQEGAEGDSRKAENRKLPNRRIRKEFHRRRKGKEKNIFRYSEVEGG
jgi:hypothetical protein